MKYLLKSFAIYADGRGACTTSLGFGGKIDTLQHRDVDDLSLAKQLLTATVQTEDFVRILDY